MAGENAKQRRAVAALNWLTKTYAPTFLRLAKLPDYAETLARTAPLMSLENNILIEELHRDLWRKVKLERSGWSESTYGLDAKDPVWEITARTFGEAGVGGKALEIASEIWTVADGASKIAVERAGVSVDLIGSTADRLRAELVDI